MLIGHQLGNRRNNSLRIFLKYVKRSTSKHIFFNLLVLLICLTTVIRFIFWLLALIINLFYPTTTKHTNIAFFIQVSNTSLLLLPRLLRAIYHPNNFYVIHFDYKIGHQATRSLSILLRRDPHYRRNVKVIQSQAISYAGISMVLNTIDAISNLLNMSQQWHYFINLSASDYPLVSPSNLRNLLSSSVLKDKRINFLQHQIADKDTYWFFNKRIAHTYIDTSLWTTIISSQSNNTVHHQGSLIDLNTTHPITSQVANIPFVKAEAWVILHRSFCQYVIDSDLSRRLLLTYSTSRAADELFFPTLLSISETFRHTIAWDSLRYILWGWESMKWSRPAFLDTFQYHHQIREDLIKSGALFSRKFQNSESSLLDFIDANVSGIIEYQYLRNDNAVDQYYQRAKKRLECIVIRRDINSCKDTK